MKLNNSHDNKEFTEKQQEAIFALQDKLRIRYENQAKEFFKRHANKKLTGYSKEWEGIYMNNSLN